MEFTIWFLGDFDCFDELNEFLWNYGGPSSHILDFNKRVSKCASLAWKNESAKFEELAYVFYFEVFLRTNLKPMDFKTPVKAPNWNTQASC